jgi:hypothetical protein
MFQFQATIDGVKTLKNHTLKISLETQDTSLFKPEELASLFNMADKTFWTGWAEQEVKEEDLKPKKVEKGAKSPGQRLKAVLYVYWEQNKPVDKFEDFYKSYMEKRINEVKERLN